MYRRLLLLNSFILCFFVCGFSANFLSVSAITSEDIISCSEGDSIVLTLNNVSADTLDSIEVKVQLPLGINYIIGSVYGAIEWDTSNLNQPSFWIDLLDTMQTTQLSFFVEYNCLTELYEDGQGIVDSVYLSYWAMDTLRADTIVSDTFWINTVNLSVQNGINLNFLAQEGDTFTRCFTVTNTDTIPISEIEIIDEFQSGLEVLFVNIGTLNFLDSLSIVVWDSSIFRLYGDMDSLFEFNESIAFCEYVSKTNCDTVISNFHIYSNCLNNSCLIADTNALIVPSFDMPLLSVNKEDPFPVCSDSGISYQNEIQIINMGLDTSLNTNLVVYLGADSLLFDSTFISYVDTGSIQLTMNDSTWQVYDIDSLWYIASSMPCSGNKIAGFQISLPDLSIMDTLYLNWNTNTCCNQDSLNYDFLSWHGRIQYEGNCDSSFVDTLQGFQGGSVLGSLLNAQGPTYLDSLSAEPFTLSIAPINNQFPSFGIGNYILELNLPPCIEYSGGFTIQDSSMSSWFPDTIFIDSNVVQMLFSTSQPFWQDTCLAQFNLIANCSSCEGIQGDIISNLYFQPSDTCSCNILVDSIHFENVYAKCSEPCDNGLYFHSFSTLRENYGYPDNNNDGLPDNFSDSLNYTLVQTKRLLFEDTLNMHFEGVVYSTDSNKTWNNLFIETTLKEGSVYSFQEMDLTIYDASALDTIQCSFSNVDTLMVNGSDYTYRFDLGLDSLLSLGCALPGFNYAPSDSIVVNIHYVVSSNIGLNELTTHFSSRFFLSDTNNIADSVIYLCDTLYDYAKVYGYDISSDINTLYNVSGCDMVVVTNQQKFQIGPCCDGTEYHQIFPYEYRYFGHLSTIETLIPDGFNISDAQFQQISINEINFDTSIVQNLTNQYLIGDTIVFPVDSIFQGVGGTFLEEDEEYASLFTYTLSPNCLVLPDSNLPLHSSWSYALFSGSIEKANEDTVYYNAPNVVLSTAQSNSYGLDGEVVWNVQISNTTGVDAYNVWLGVDSLFEIDIVQVNGVSNNQTYTLSNGLFEIGVLAANETINLQLIGNYSSCNSENFMLSAGWNCGSVPGYLDLHPCNLTTLSLSYIPTFCSSQNNEFVLVTSEIPDNLNVCGVADTVQISVYNPTPFLMTNMVVEFAMPEGVQIIPNTAQGVNEVPVTDLTHPIFELPDLDSLSTNVFSFLIEANCEALDFANEGNVFEDTIRIEYMANGNTWNEEDVLDGFNLQSPGLAVSTFTNQTYSGDIGDDFQRCLTIVNSGSGSLESFTLVENHGHGLQIDSVNVSFWQDTLSQLTAIIGSEDFLLWGNNDSLFDAGESIQVCESIHILNCISVNTEYDISWGCNAETCQGTNTSANVLFPGIAPELTFVASSSAEVCHGDSIDHQQRLMVINTGLGTAKAVEVEVYQGTASNGYSSSGISSYFDSASFVLEMNNIVQTFTIDSFNVSSSTNDCSQGELNRVFLNVPDIEEGDTLFISWNTKTCCDINYDNDRYFMRWTAQGTFQNACEANFGVFPIQGASDDRLYFTFLDDGSPILLDSSQSKTFHIRQTNFVNSLNLDSNLSYYKYELVLNPCLNYEGNLGIVDAAESMIWNPDSILVNGDTILAFFNATEATWGSQSTIGFDLSANCDSCSNSSSAFKLNLHYVPTESCGCEMFVGQFSYSPYIVCTGDSCGSGITITNFNFLRTSYGEPDNDDDGIADALGTIDFSKIKTKRLMFGDTLRASYRGYVNDGDIENWDFAYVESAIANADGLTYLEGLLRVHDFSAGSTYEVAVSPDTIIGTGSTRTYVFDLSVAPFITLGDFPSGFQYGFSDTLELEVHYEISKNVSNTLVNSVSVANMYSSLIEAPVHDSDKYQCNTLYDNYYLVGYRYRSSGQSTYNLGACQQASVSQNYYFDLGPWNNIFPYEYRNWGYMDSVRIDVPDNYNLLSARMREYRTSGSGSLIPSSFYDLNYETLEVDSFLFPTDTLYESLGGSLLLSDDGFYGQVIAVLEPTCLTNINIHEYVRHEFVFGASHFLEGSVTSNTVSALQDRVYYNAPQLFLQSDLPTVNGLDSIVYWDITLSNLTSYDAENAWVGLPENTGISILNVYDLDNDSNLNRQGEIFQMGTVDGSDTRRFRIYAHYTSCSPDVITAYAGWNCSDGYPTDVASYPCSSESILLKVVPQFPNLVINDINIPDSIDLCDSAIFVVELENTQLGTAYNLRMRATIPPSTEIVSGSSFLKFPNNTSFVQLNDPTLVSGTIWEWNLSAQNELLDTLGLKGILNTSLNKLQVSFKLITGCGYTSGSKIAINFLGNSNCGSEHSQQTIYSPRLRLAGALEPYITEIDLKTSFITPCAENATLEVSILNTGVDLTAIGDSITIALPPGVSYVPNSYTPLYNSALPVEPSYFNFNGFTWLTWPLVDSILPGDSVVFKIKYSGDGAMLDCEVVNFQAFTTSSVDLNCITTGQLCDIKILTGDRILPVYVFKSFLALNNLEANTQVLSADSELVFVSYNITNSGEDLLSNNSFTVSFYEDVDNSGSVTSGDLWLYNDVNFVDVLNGASLQLSDTFVAPSGSTCQILAVLNIQDNPCICDSVVTFRVPQSFNFLEDQQIVCSEEDLYIGNFEQLNYTYSWTPFNLINDSSAANPLFQFQNSSTNIASFSYMVEVTKEDGCSYLDSTEILVYPLPEVELSVIDSVFCLDDSLEIINLNPIGGILNGTGVYTNLFYPDSAGAGQYQVDYVYTDSIGCINYDTISLTVNPLPEVSIFSLMPHYCVMDVEDSILATPIGGTFAGNGISGNIFNPLLADIDTHTITYTFIDSNTCVGVVDSQTIVHANPEAVFSTNNQCQYDAVVLNNTSSVLLDSISLVSWSFGDGDSSSTFAPQHFYDTSGVYTIHLEVVSNYGCRNNYEDSVFVFDVPKASFTWSDICYLDTINFNDSSSLAQGSIASWQWSFGDTVQSTEQNPAYVYSNVGFYEVELFVTSDSGCVDSITHQVQIMNLPQVDFENNINVICKNECVDFVDLTTADLGDTLLYWTWIIADSTYNMQNPVVCYDSNGYFPVQLIVESTTGCVDSVSRENVVFIHDLPVASFTTIPEDVENNFEPFIQFVDSSYTDIVFWQWSFGDGVVVESTEPKYVYEQPGAYEVQLVVEDINTCRDTANKTLNIKEGIITPNVFTPNGDGMNDLFYFPVIGNIEFELFIYSRWGEVIFYSQASRLVWDGRSSAGILQADGTYYYTLKAINVTSDRSHSGFITLLR